ncbi:MULTISPECIES: hypothetical protein [Flavobacterium]|uniref:hypothetical protein n=1 Tax=Flavobacterium TaxID=237 RepID=UPI001183B381|nr:MULTISPECIES: hypothetical protein [Flavobacterium]MCR4031660.1 energy transducer TonB [Flavobacterium panacis]
MNNKHKITIPKPCHENWDQMTPNENGRFCLSCSKTVIDFTDMLSEDIQQFFIQNNNQKVCGRFRKSQLDSITVQIPDRILYSQTNYRKMFLLALFIAMGTTLFSCADKDGKKKKIEKIEVVTKTTSTEPIMVGEPAIDENDTIHNVVPPPPPPKVNKVKFVNPKGTDKSVCVKSEKTNNNKKQVAKEPIYINGEVASYVNAEFPGGIDQFYTFFSKEFKTPEDQYLKNSKIKISFAVEKDGSMSYLQSEPAIDKSLEQEIIRVLKACPKWQPGLLDGKKTKMQYSLPIAF